MKRREPWEPGDASGADFFGILGFLGIYYEGIRVFGALGL